MEKNKIREFYTNKDGKLSGSGFIGFAMGLVAVIGFIVGTFGWFLEVTRSLEYLHLVLELGLLSSILLGVRKASGAFRKEATFDENKG